MDITTLIIHNVTCAFSKTMYVSVIILIIISLIIFTPFGITKYKKKKEKSLSYIKNIKNT